MTLWAAKILGTLTVILLVSELVKTSGQLGAFVAAMPLVTLMVMIWMRVEAQPVDRIAEYGYLTFWYVLPTLPMFLLTPWLLGRSLSFSLALSAGLLTTALSLLLTSVVARRFGFELLG